MPTTLEAPVAAADAKGAVEDEMIAVEDVVASETLGYFGGAHEEHSGEAVSAAVDEEDDAALETPAW
jgi:hypothetical protein